MAIKPREIWQKATPLDEAWLVFSDSKLRDQYRQEIDPLADPLPENATGKLLAMARVLTSPQRQKQMIAEMRAALVSQLSAEKLLAVAYPLKPSTARIPRYIGAAFWTGATIIWEAARAHDPASEYHRIRIFDLAGYPTDEVSPRIGRKTNEGLIYEAIAECLTGDPSFIDKKQKLKVEFVRAAIKARRPELDPYGPGFGNDAVRKHITAYFRKNPSGN